MPDRSTPGRRCCLSVPGADRDKIAKAYAAAPDEVVLDLEDGVAPVSKDAARDTVARWICSQEGDGANIAVRVNAVRTAWCHRDVAACSGAPGPPRSIILPKVESAGDLNYIDRLLDGVERESGVSQPVTVQALIESAAGLANLDAIVDASPRLSAVILGYADLATSLGRSGQVDGQLWLPAQHAVLVAGRRAGVEVIDGPFLGVDTGEDFERVVEHAAGMGFDGKWVIHPRQIDSVVSAFTPSPSEVEHARRVLAEVEHRSGFGEGAFQLDGQMIDEAVARAARRTLARAGIRA